MRKMRIIVTGAASGIGLACARRLTSDGHVVAALDIAMPALEQAFSENADVETEYLDVATPESCSNSVEAAAERLSGLDAIIHCAAVWSGTPWGESQPDEWDRILAINLRGSFLVAKAAAKQFVRSGGGSIILTASDSARVGGVAGGPAYAASKGGVISLTRSLARALGPENVRVNAINPGVVASAMTRSWPKDLLAQTAARTPLGRIGQPEDIADVACFLASDDSRFVNGEVIEVNGGFYFD